MYVIIAENCFKKGYLGNCEEVVSDIKDAHKFISLFTVKRTLHKLENKNIDNDLEMYEPICTGILNLKTKKFKDIDII